MARIFSGASRPSSPFTSAAAFLISARESMNSAVRRRPVMWKFYEARRV